MPTVHDFRSDTVTLPTAAMRAAMAEAALGDAARGDDPTVNALESLACRITGKEAALLLPSGAMANLAALLAHKVRGGEVIVEAESHLYNAEGGALSVVAGAVARPLAGHRGVLDAGALRDAIRGDADLARAPTRLVCLENTHNAAGGTVWPPAALTAATGVAHEAGVPVHMDGARLFNAAAFLGLPVAALCAPVDSVWFSLCKGLGGPIGAVLAGSQVFMQRARRAARLLGGGMRQAGLIAAPALVALRDPYPAHRRDHRLARRLAEGLAAIDPSLVELDRVQTNIVNCAAGRHAGEALSLVQALAERGVRVLSRTAQIRFVTHADVDESAVDHAIASMASVLAGRSGAAARPVEENR